MGSCSNRQKIKRSLKNMDSLANYESTDDSMYSEKIAIYARTAVYDVQKINDQIKRCKGFITSKGWSLENIEVYAENGFSGSDEQRTDLQQMLQDIDSDMYEILVVDDLTRLSRNSSLSQIIVDKLIQRNIQIFIVSGNFSLTKQSNPYHFLDLMSQI